MWDDSTGFASVGFVEHPMAKRMISIGQTLPIATFYIQALGVGDPLPSVVSIDPNLGSAGTTLEDDEHPPTDSQRRQWHVSDVVNAIRGGPYWKNSIIFVTYDEHGGFYDHARPPKALRVVRARLTVSRSVNAGIFPILARANNRGGRGVCDQSCQLDGHNAA